MLALGVVSVLHSVALGSLTWRGHSWLGLFDFEDSTRAPSWKPGIQLAQVVRQHCGRFVSGSDVLAVFTLLEINHVGGVVPPGI